VALSEAGARLVAGDLADPQALTGAAQGVDATFGLSVPFGSGGKDEEVAQGRLLVDAAGRPLAQLRRLGPHDRLGPRF
jgi:uncharacterized protein YbjT (DUF2867 family)